MTEVRGVGQPNSASALPKSGMKLADLQKTNKLLFDYFKNQGVKEDQYVTSSDIEKLKEKLDADKSGEVSVKEAKAELKGSKKEIKAAIKSMDTVANTKIEDNPSASVKVDDNNTDFYENGTRVKSVYKDENSEIVKEYASDGQTLKQATGTTKTEDGKEIKAKTVYYQGNKNFTDIETDEDKTTIIYNPALGNDKPTRKVRVLKDSEGKPTESTETTEYSKYGEGKARTETITYSGDLVKDGVTKRVVEYDEDGNVISDVANPEDEVQNNDQKGQAKELPKFKVPAGWSMSQIAKAHGISVEDLKKANVDEDGNPTYKTNKKGVPYIVIGETAFYGYMDFMADEIRGAISEAQSSANKFDVLKELSK